jgi:tetratricopeptide (TPR) repeat protein
MSETQPRDLDLEANAANPGTEPDVTKPVKEPWVWTPERALEWHRYYDLYLIAFVLLLIFIASSHLIVASMVWTHLQAGRLTAVSGPVTSDPFSYTQTGERWVNIPWVFQWMQAAIHDAALQLDLGNRDQLAAGVLVGLAAFIRALTAWVLIQVRRPGPGLWWSGVVALLAFGAMFGPVPAASSPFTALLGGVAQPAEVEPTTWGVLLMALLVWFVYLASDRGRPRLLLALPPMFLLWANLDSSFLYGLLLLICLSIGMLVRRAQGGPGLPLVLGTLVGCVAATFVNPSLAAIYPAAAAPFARLVSPSSELLSSDLAYIGPRSWAYYNGLHGGPGSNGAMLYVAYYAILVGAGLASFALNRKNFRLGRFLAFAVFAVMLGALRTTSPMFAVVWAFCVALNGQEWYLDRFGARGRASFEWRLFSVGGRSITLVIVFALMVKGLTGYGASPGEPIFGFGFNPDDFAFESADYLAQSKITGNVLNLNLSTGDSLIWRAWPTNSERKTFVDSRENLFSPRFRSDLQGLTRALADGDREAWAPTLDKYNVSVVMVPLGLTGNPIYGRVATAMASSPDWIGFYDDGNVLLFGRADASADDLAVIEGRRLDPANLAYKVSRSIPPVERPPTPTTMLDRVFRNRTRRGMQPHVTAAMRWLNERNPDPTQPVDLANVLLAVGEAHTALAQNPDDTAAWRLLAASYRELTRGEGAIFERETGSIPAVYLGFRLRQQIAALHFAIQSTPPAQDAGSRTLLADLHRGLANLYQEQQYYDLARDQLAAARSLYPADLWTAEDQTRLDQLTEAVEQVRTELDRLVEEQQASPLQLIDPALQNGCLGLAIEKLDEAEATGLAQGPLRAQLVDLYCLAGWPDRALEVIDTGNVEDPALNTGPGSASYRSGTVYLLLGNYDVTTSLWLRAARQVQGLMSAQSLEATRSFLRGLVREAADQMQEFPELERTRSQWEAELGLVLLEAGQPSLAGERMEAALKLNPAHPLRPILAYYLQKIGREVPPPPEPPAKTEFAPGASGSPVAPASPASSELPANPFATVPGEAAQKKD